MATITTAEKHNLAILDLCQSRWVSDSNQKMNTVQMLDFMASVMISTKYIAGWKTRYSVWSKMPSNKKVSLAIRLIAAIETHMQGVPAFIERLIDLDAPETMIAKERERLSKYNQ